MNKEMNTENKYYDVFEDDCDNNKKLKLTRKNADFIEAVLAIDSNYKDASNPKKVPSIEYVDYLEEEDINMYNEKLHEYGSGKFWIDQFVKIIESNDKKHTEEVELKYEQKVNREKVEKRVLGLQTILNGVICAIDRENSTHLTAHHSKKRVGRSNVSQRIYDYIKKEGIETFKNKLLKKDDFSLIGLITVPKEKDKENYHYSFATKFCKYVSLGFGEDKYYIYDNIVINNIDYYIAKYSLDNKKYNKKELEFDKNKINSKTNEEYKKIADKYEKLHKCLDEIREKAKIDAKDEKELRRDEIDHIIWYFNK